MCVDGLVGRWMDGWIALLTYQLVCMEIPTVFVLSCEGGALKNKTNGRNDNATPLLKKEGHAIDLRRR